MEKYMKEWEQICKEFCKQNNYELLFVNVDSFGFEDTQEQLHHVYADELVELLKNKKED